MTKFSLKFDLNTEESELPHFMIAKIRYGDKVKYLPIELPLGKGMWPWPAIANDRDEDHRGLFISAVLTVMLEYMVDDWTPARLSPVHTRDLRDGYVLFTSVPNHWRMTQLGSSPVENVSRFLPRNSGSF